MWAVTKPRSGSGQDGSPNRRVGALRFSSSTRQNFLNVIHIGCAFLNATADGSLCIPTPELRMLRLAFSPSRKHLRRRMRPKFLRLIIRCLLKELRRLKCMRRKRIALKESNMAKTSQQIFVLESFFVRELITMLTPRQNEEMLFLTGPKIGPIRIVCRWARPVSLDRQTPVFVRATARSVADVLIPIIEQ